MVQLTKGFDAARAAQAFGVRNTLASEALKSDPVTSEEFVQNNGDLDKAAKPNTLRGGLNKSFPQVSEIQTIKSSSITAQVKQETNIVSFAVNNAFEQPFQKQGDLTKLAGEVGRKLDSTA